MQLHQRSRLLQVVLIGLPLTDCSEAGMKAITKSTNADFIHLLHFNRIIF